MQLLFEHDAPFADFVAKSIGMPRPFTNYRAVGTFDDTGILGAFVYHNYHPEEGVIEISAASRSKRWFNATILRALFEIPFDQYGCQLVVMRASTIDWPIRRMLTRYGFHNVVIPRLRGRDLDETIFTLTDDAWRSNTFNARFQRG